MPILESLQSELVGGLGAGPVSTAVMEMDPALDLRAGELVEVRSRHERFSAPSIREEHWTRCPSCPRCSSFVEDDSGSAKRADKVCDTIDWGTLRRMERAVHLEGVRCNGGAHGGCQAGCLIHWKEAWLKRVVDPPTLRPWVCPIKPMILTTRTPAHALRGPSWRLPGRSGTERRRSSLARPPKLIRATTSIIPWWSVGQYIRDVRSGNVGVGNVLRGLLVGFFNKFQKANVRILPRLTLIHSGRTYPFVLGRLSGRTLSADLGLQPGELVEVKSKEEIFETLDERDRTRGLRFDGETLQYCGRRGRVLRRIQKIIDEKTGRMLSIESDCIVIDGFICTGDYHRSCPRAVYPYWRESWLKRVEEDSSDLGRRPATP